MKGTRKRRVVAFVAATAVAVGAVGIAGAAVPDGNGVIRACYSKNGGALRVSDTGSCRSTELAISWNNVGPAGLTWKGEWASGTAYAVRDAVAFQGSSYIAIFANQGSQPARTGCCSPTRARRVTRATPARRAPPARRARLGRPAPRDRLVRKVPPARRVQREH